MSVKGSDSILFILLSTIVCLKLLQSNISSEICLQSTLSAFFNAAQNGHCSKLYIFHMDNLCSWHVFGPMEAAEVEMEKSVFLFSSSIQHSQNFLFNVLGLWTWKCRRKVLKSQLLIELLTESSKNRNVSRLKMMKIKCKEKKSCKNVCGGTV